jgi:outer membrane lipoprotein-sorting protein
LLCLLVASATSAADDQADIKETIAKAVKAAGGESKLAAMKGVSWRESGTYYGMGGGIPFTASIAYHYPDRMRVEIDNFATIVTSNGKSWFKSAMGVEELTGERLKGQLDALHSDTLSTLLPLKDKAYKLSKLEETKINEMPAVGVRVSHEKHRTVDLYFDKSSGLLVKRSEKVKSDELGGKEVTQETLFSNYKDVDGVQLAGKAVTSRDGEKYIETEHDEFKILANPDAKLFEKPE